MSLFALTEPSEPFVAPALVAAFDGWIDAAGASTAAAALMAEGGNGVATFDTDALYDYRARRPPLDIVDGVLTRLTWPQLALVRRRVDGRDLLVLTGPEPDFRWQELGRDLQDLCLRLGVVEWVSTGSIPAAVPHTRPVHVFATATKAGLLHNDEQQGPTGLMRVPAAALSVIEMIAQEGGTPGVGFYAQIPHYVSGGFAAASIAILEHVGRHLGVELPLGTLPDEAAAQRERIDAAVAAGEDSQAYVARLEAIVDGQEAPPAGDELIQEIERFLQQRSDGEQGPGPGTPFREP